MNAHEPAFPTPDEMLSHVLHTGLTKREEFAKAAMQGILASSYLNELTDKVAAQDKTNPCDSIAKMAVLQADALLAALEKKPV